MKYLYLLLLLIFLVVAGALLKSHFSQKDVVSGFYSPSTPTTFTIGTSTPVANFTAQNSATTSTTTIELGKSNTSIGTCIKLYRTDGSAIYVSVPAGATTFLLTTTACASVAGF